MEAKTFMPLHRVALIHGIPAAWLRDEVEAGRVPFLRVGRRFLLNCEIVERVLLERAEQSARPADQGALAHA